LNLLESIESEQGLPQETGWLHDQAIWGYSGLFYAQVWLYSGYPSKAIDYLYSFANHAAPSVVWREEQALTNSNSNKFWGDMPHNWASAEFIRLIRNLLVFEKGSNLELLAGLPKDWLPYKNHPLIMEETPTKFGKVSINLSNDSKSYLVLDFKLEKGNQTPNSIILHWPEEVIEIEGRVEKISSNKWKLIADQGTYKLALPL